MTYKMIRFWLLVILATVAALLCFWLYAGYTGFVEARVRVAANRQREDIRVVINEAYSDGMFSVEPGKYCFEIRNDNFHVLSDRRKTSEYWGGKVWAYRSYTSCTAQFTPFEDLDEAVEIRHIYNVTNGTYSDGIVAAHLGLNKVENTWQLLWTH